MVPVIPQLPIRVQLARTDEVVELRDGLLGVLARRAVEVAVEDAAAGGGFSMQGKGEREGRRTGSRKASRELKSKRGA